MSNWFQEDTRPNMWTTDDRIRGRPTVVPFRVPCPDWVGEMAQAQTQGEIRVGPGSQVKDIYVRAIRTENTVTIMQHFTKFFSLLFCT